MFKTFFYFLYTFSQVYLIINGKRVKKKKTGTVRSENPSNPVWNEAFTFNITQSNMSNAGLEVSVLLKLFVTGNFIIICVVEYFDFDK